MEFSFTFGSVIRGYHVYKFVWTPFILSLSAVDGNENSPASNDYNQGVLLEYFVQVENQCL